MCNKGASALICVSRHIWQCFICCNLCADWGSVTTEDATQNAALAAILFLAGGVGKDSSHCIVTLVGSDPTVRPLVLNRKQATKMLDQRVSQVQHAKVSRPDLHM